MKKSFFILILSATIFTTSPLLAMDEDKNQQTVPVHSDTQVVDLDVNQNKEKPNPFWAGLDTQSNKFPVLRDMDEANRDIEKLLSDPKWNTPISDENPRESIIDAFTRILWVQNESADAHSTKEKK